MSPDSPSPTPYEVIYSEKVRQRLVAMADIATRRGDGEAFLAALREFHRRLRLYPQFGEQLEDLVHESGQIWIGFVHPLAMRYGVLDERRLVMVALMPVLLRKSNEAPMA